MRVGVADSSAQGDVVRRGVRGAAWLTVILAGLGAPALAQTAAPTVSTGQTSSFGPQASVTIKSLLADGYEIKTGFVDPNGGAYLALQKTTSAYFCHSNPTPTCEKLN